MAENCQTRRCSCEDAGLHTPCPVCNPVPCPVPNPCPEIFSDDCIIHTGDGLPLFGIETGDTLSQIIQKIVLYHTVSAPCLANSPINFHSTTVTSTAIYVAWTIQGSPIALQVKYSTDNVIWLQNPALAATATSDVIGNALTPDTYYYIKVEAEQVDHSKCASVTIKVKTNPLTA